LPKRSAKRDPKERCGERTAGKRSGGFSKPIQRAERAVDALTMSVPGGRAEVPLKRGHFRF